MNLLVADIIEPDATQIYTQSPLVVIATNPNAIGTLQASTVSSLYTDVTTGRQEIIATNTITISNGGTATAIFNYAIPFNELKQPWIPSVQYMYNLPQINYTVSSYNLNTCSVVFFNNTGAVITNMPVQVIAQANPFTN